MSDAILEHWRAHGDGNALDAGGANAGPGDAGVPTN